MPVGLIGRKPAFLAAHLSPRAADAVGDRSDKRSVVPHRPLIVGHIVGAKRKAVANAIEPDILQDRTQRQHRGREAPRP